MKKKTIFIAYSLLLFVTIVVFEAVAKRLDPGWGNNPIEQLSGMYIAVIFYLGYVLYSWKSNLSEFLKRFSISIPFAMMFSVFVKVLVYDIYLSTLGGMFVSILLLLKTSNWKKHIVVILIASCVYTIFLTEFLRLSNPWDESYVNSFAKQGFMFLGVVLIHCFLMLYLAKIVKEERIPDLKTIFIRSLRFSVAVSLFFTAINISIDFGLRLSLPLSIQLLVNILLSILFIVIAYKFDLFLTERKKRPKKRNRIDELRNELNEFYLSEREKLKK